MNQPVQPPPPFVMIRGESIDLQPHSVVGADGQTQAVVIFSIRNPIAAASVGMGIAELDQHIEQCQRLRASHTGGLTVAKTMPDGLR